VPSQEDIEQQQKLLTTHRNTLLILLEQCAKSGTAFVPPATVHSIREARASIRELKKVLHDWGVQVDDLPQDEDTFVLALYPETVASYQTPGVQTSDMQSTRTRQLRVFLCHASDDRLVVRDLYWRLRLEGVEPWLDEEELLPGVAWDQAIRRAVRQTDVVLVCLSKKSSTKAGYIQKEIRYVLDVADEQPKDTIFVIPVKLEDCTVPKRLIRWQWVELYNEKGFNRIITSLEARGRDISLSVKSQLELGQNKNDEIEEAISIRLDNPSPDFVDWCSMVLYQLHHIASSSQLYRPDIEPMVLAQYLFDKDFISKIEARKIQHHAPMRYALEELKKQGFIEQVGIINPKWRVLQRGLSFLKNTNTFWSSIWQIRLNKEQEQLLRCINGSNLRANARESGIIMLSHELILRDLGWNTMDQLLLVAEELKRIDLIDMMGIKDYFEKGYSALFCSTLRGLIWETRRGFTSN
jgi:hypothetical protein